MSRPPGDGRRVRPALLAVAAALLVVLAGCGALGSGDGGEPTPGGTVTPAPLPDPGPTATPAPTPRDRLAAFPAIDAEGRINASELFASHVAYLSTRSYTLTWERRTAGGSGAITQEYDRRVAVGADGTVLVRNEDGGTDPTVTYGDRDGAYRRVTGPNGSTVSPASVRLTDPVGERYAETVSFELLTFLNRGYDSLEVVTREGRRYARVVSDSVPPQIPETYSAYAVHDFKATLWIAPEGYVRSIHYEFDLRNIDERIAVEWRYTYDRVGRTTVERPAWVPEATPTPAPTPDPSRVPPPTVANGSTTG